MYRGVVHKNNMRIPRLNKSKEQIQSEINQVEKVKHIKDVVRRVYPLLQDVDSIYDAQTVLNALQGFIKVDLETVLDEITIGYLAMEFEQEKDSKIKEAMLAIVKEMADEPADEFSQTIERLARAFSDYGSTKFLKNPMSELKIEDILAD